MKHPIKTFVFVVLSIARFTDSVNGQTHLNPELVYSVNRIPEPPFNTARAVVVITGEAIRRKNSRTLPEVLMEEAGIFVQQTNYGGGSPIIRGLMGKQILILVDGVKLNNATYRNSEEAAGGGAMGEQAATGYRERAANLGIDYFLSDERTISLSYLALEQNDVPRTDKIIDGTNLLFTFDPQRLQLVRCAYQDLTPRKLSDFLQVTTYWNRQDEDRQEIRASNPGVERFLSDAQTVSGLNLELGSFVGESHRLIYGVDYASEDIHSTRRDVNLVSGLSSSKRGNYTDRASYNTLAVENLFDEKYKYHGSGVYRPGRQLVVGGQLSL